MARRHVSQSKPDPSVIDGALETMDAEELRALVRDMLLELDDRAHGRIVNSFIERAARGASGWTPPGPSAKGVAEVISFVAAATRVGYADASEVDDYLRQGANAFLGKDYAAAFEIFGALLPPIGEGDIDLGQHELVDEVLGADLSTCAAQYVVSMYMTAAQDHRAQAVHAAIDEVEAVGSFWEPLREIERVAIEPLPGFDEFLPRWRALIEASEGPERRGDWNTDKDHWLREIVQRMEGSEGLARIARSTKRADDLRAWCQALFESRNWKAALSAYGEAAELVADDAYSRGDFLDGAALAAQELGRKNLPVWLERAWREAASMLRLRRWLGSSNSKRSALKRAGLALDACPKKAHRQRTLLHVLLGDHESAAKLLAAAPGLGWSDSEHPGHLLFPLFHNLLGGGLMDPPPALPVRWPSRRMDMDELEWMDDEDDEPRLATPGVDEIVELVGIDQSLNDSARTAVLKAMRTAAEKRLAGVIENKRRRHYGHAAQLVAACAALDSNEASRWVAGIRAEYSRFSALQRELDKHVGRA